MSSFGCRHGIVSCYSGRRTWPHPFRAPLIPPQAQCTGPAPLGCWRPDCLRLMTNGSRPCPTQSSTTRGRLGCPTDCPQANPSASLDRLHLTLIPLTWACPLLPFHRRGRRRSSPAALIFLPAPHICAGGHSTRPSAAPSSPHQECFCCLLGPDGSLCVSLTP